MDNEFLDANITVIMRIRTCFYLLLPSETYFSSLEEMPNLVGRVVPILTFAMLLEMVIMRMQGRKNDCRINHTVITWAQTAMYDAFNNFLFRGIELTLYIWVYDNFRIATFQWDSVITWIVTLLSVEFYNYWWHRCGHETAIMWAAHELHHSSEDFNLSIAFRNNSIMRFFRWIFYVPLAPLGIPVAVMWTHVTLGALFNTFAHSALTPKINKIIPGIGHAVEFIFVTPSHHRVHHGSNKYCIDKNYGQYLIIWDRLFGTFAEEKEDEPLTYGVLTQLQTYDIASVQFSSFVSLWRKIQSMSTFGDKVRAVFYGPGWMPGKPRLGDPDDIPDVRGRTKWDKELPVFLNIYLIVNIACVFFIYVSVMERLQVTPQTVHLVTLIYIFFGFSALGGLFDGKGTYVYLEFLRIVFSSVIMICFPIIASRNLTVFFGLINTTDLLLLPLIYKLDYLSSSPKKYK